MTVCFLDDENSKRLFSMIVSLCSDCPDLEHLNCANEDLCPKATYIKVTLIGHVASGDDM